MRLEKSILCVDIDFKRDRRRKTGEDWLYFPNSEGFNDELKTELVFDFCMPRRENGQEMNIRRDGLLEGGVKGTGRRFRF